MNADNSDGALECRVMAAPKVEGPGPDGPHRSRAIGLAAVPALIAATGVLLVIEARGHYLRTRRLRVQARAL